ncbi:fimbrial biogenesis chaperone [Serratia sp. L9]|uniref:fimbrial biogenesis chaperone n=1 Tax=Serratia sp. L9 TaxID=3423946 RepID=UPI003D66FB4B
MHFINFIIFCMLTIISGATYAGVIVGATRVIYDGNKKEVSLSVRNPEKNTNYLIQSWLDNYSDTDNKKVPFTVTPPLFLLNSNRENLLRIIKIADNSPTDRESVYWLSVKSVAAVPNTTANRLQIAVRTRIKLFYRPENLTGKPEEAYKFLQFSQSGSQLKVTNPTPYHVSFFNLSVGGYSIKEPGMVAPMGSQILSLPLGVKGAVEWQAINDYGGHSDIYRQ